MKRYRVTRTNEAAGFGGWQDEEAVVELANDKPPPPGAVEVDETVELHDWQPAAPVAPAAEE